MKLLSTFFLLFVTCLTFSQDEKLIVGIKDSPPFVINIDNQYSGVSIDLWEEVAKELDIEYELKEYNLTDLLLALENGEVDISINPLTVTAERLARFDFTQPFYVTSLAIAVKSQVGNSVLGFMKKLMSVGFIKAVLFLFAIVFIFGLILWLVERKKNNEQFHQGYKGLGDGIWWSAVTMTTVGYGDKSPRTALGRIISVIWMFTAVIVISSFTAGIASSLTVNQLETSIKNMNDLKRVKVGTLKSSASISFLKDYGIDFQEFDHLEDGLNAVAKDKIQAFVFDEAILRYMINAEHYNEELIIIPSAYSKEYFGFASKNQHLINRINPVMIEKIETIRFRNILERYNLESK